MNMDRELEQKCHDYLNVLDKYRKVRSKLNELMFYYFKVFYGLNNKSLFDDGTFLKKYVNGKDFINDSFFNSKYIKQRLGDVFWADKFTKIHYTNVDEYY